MANRDSLYTLNVRQPFSFLLGTHLDSDFIRFPVLKAHDYSADFANYLMTRYKIPNVKGRVSTYTKKEIFYNHLHCRNRLFSIDDYLFEGCESTVKIIKNPSVKENWLKNLPCISVMSICRKVEVDQKMNFGAGLTMKRPFIFKLTRDDDSNVEFDSVYFIDDDNDCNFTDVCVSDYINGEFLFVSKNGMVTLFDGYSKKYNFDIIDFGEFENATVSFFNHPRVVTVSSKNYLSVVDLRINEGNKFNCPIKDVSAITTIDFNHIGVANNKGLSLIDVRFPTKIDTFLGCELNSTPVSIRNTKIDGLNCVYAQLLDDSNVVIFPFNDTSYSPPISPFDISIKDFITFEENFLTGISFIDDNAYIQFENDALIKLKLVKNENPSHHFFTYFMRSTDYFKRDIFEFEPKFEDISKEKSNKNDMEPNWNNIVGKSNLEPPNELIYNSPDVEIEPNDSTTYLIEDDIAFDLDEENIPEALNIFWQSHINVARQNLKKL